MFRLNIPLKKIEKISPECSGFRFLGIHKFLIKKLKLILCQVTSKRKPEYFRCISSNNYLRREIWAKNFEYVNEHNKQAIQGKHTFKLKMNEFGDLVSKY